MVIKPSNGLKGYVMSLVPSRDIHHTQILIRWKYANSIYWLRYTRKWDSAPTNKWTGLCILLQNIQNVKESRGDLMNREDPIRKWNIANMWHEHWI